MIQEKIFSNTYFQGSSPQDQFLSKLVSLNILNEEALLRADKPLPPIKPIEAQPFYDWILFNFFVKNNNFELPVPISAYGTICHVYREMMNTFGFLPTKVSLNGGAAPFFLTNSYLLRLFEMIGVEAPEPLLTDEITSSLHKIPNDYDIKILAPHLNSEQLKHMTGCLDRFLSEVSQVNKEAIKKSAYTKRKLVKTEGNEFFITGLKGVFELDLVIAKLVKREKLFSHEFELNLNPLFLYNSLAIPIPEGRCQALIFRLAKIIHIENEETINEFGFGRVISYLTKGWRCFQKEKVDRLLKVAEEKDILSTLTIVFNGHHKLSEEKLAFFFNAKIFGLKESVHFTETLSSEASPFGKKLADLLQNTPFETVKSYLFFRGISEWITSQNTREYKIETTLNFKQETLQFFITPNCCLTLPFDPSSFKKDICTLFKTSQEVKEAFFNLDDELSPIEFHSQIRKKTHFKELNEELVLDLMTLFQVFKRVKEQISTKKSSESLKKTLEKLIELNDFDLNEVIDLTLNHPQISNFLTHSDLNHFLGKRVLLKGERALSRESPASCESILGEILKTLPLIPLKEELHQDLSDLYLKAALFLLNRAYSLRHTTDLSTYSNYNDYLKSSEDLASDFKEKTIKLLNAELNDNSFNNLESFHKQKKDGYLIIKIIYKILKILDDEPTSKMLILAIVKDFIMNLLETTTSLKDPLSKVCQAFVFTPPLKKPLHHYIHFKDSTELFSFASEKKCLSSLDAAKLSLFFNLEISPILKKELAQVEAFEELTLRVISQKDSIYLVQLGSLLRHIQPALKKYPQRFIDAHKRICDYFKEKHPMHLTRLKPVYEYLFEDIFDQSPLIGGFLPDSPSEIIFAKKLFENLFEAILAAYSKQIEKKCSSGLGFNIPLFLCDMITLSKQKGVFSQDLTEINGFIQKIVKALEEGKVFEESFSSFQTPLEDLLQLGSAPSKNLRKKIKDLFKN
jgi:hypothetical protein